MQQERDHQHPDPELQETAEHLEETGEEEFFAYPEDYLFAIFAEETQAEEALKRLAELGFHDEDVATFSGEPGAESLDSTGEEHGIMGRLLRVVQKGASNVDHMTEYENAAAQGQVVVGVYAPEEEERQRAADVLLDYDTRSVNFFGRLVVETLRH